MNVNTKKIIDKCEQASNKLPKEVKPVRPKTKAKKASKKEIKRMSNRNGVAFRNDNADEESCPDDKDDVGGRSGGGAAWEDELENTITVDDTNTFSGNFNIGHPSNAAAAAAAFVHGKVQNQGCEPSLRNAIFNDRAAQALAVNRALATMSALGGVSSPMCASQAAAQHFVNNNRGMGMGMNPIHLQQAAQRFFTNQQIEKTVRNNMIKKPQDSSKIQDKDLVNGPSDTIINDSSLKKHEMMALLKVLHGSGIRQIRSPPSNGEEEELTTKNRAVELEMEMTNAQQQATSLSASSKPSVKSSISNDMHNGQIEGGTIASQSKAKRIPTRPLNPYFTLDHDPMVSARSAGAARLTEAMEHQRAIDAIRYEQTLRQCAGMGLGVSLPNGMRFGVPPIHMGGMGFGIGAKPIGPEDAQRVQAHAAKLKKLMKMRRDLSQQTLSNFDDSNATTDLLDHVDHTSSTSEKSFMKAHIPKARTKKQIRNGRKRKGPDGIEDSSEFFSNNDSQFDDPDASSSFMIEGGKRCRKSKISASNKTAEKSVKKKKEHQPQNKALKGIISSKKKLVGNKICAQLSPSDHEPNLKTQQTKAGKEQKAAPVLKSTYLNINENMKIKDHFVVNLCEGQDEEKVKVFGLDTDSSKLQKSSLSNREPNSNTDVVKTKKKQKVAPTPRYTHADISKNMNSNDNFAVNINEVEDRKNAKVSIQDTDSSTVHKTSQVELNNLVGETVNCLTQPNDENTEEDENEIASRMVTEKGDVSFNANKMLKHFSNFNEKIILCRILTKATRNVSGKIGICPTNFKNQQSNVQVDPLNKEGVTDLDQLTYSYKPIDKNTYNDEMNKLANFDDDDVFSITLGNMKNLAKDLVGERYHALKMATNISQTKSDLSHVRSSISSPATDPSFHEEWVKKEEMKKEIDKANNLHQTRIDKLKKVQQDFVKSLLVKHSADISKLEKRMEQEVIKHLDKDNSYMIASCQALKRLRNEESFRMI
mmetsp:Transcript_2607/g.3689  ORF Transcript_2607/g.3689 Transcript_2607/m.3689 type:complete len:987 (-) Transcript_2607:132-3092(-)